MSNKVTVTIQDGTNKWQAVVTNKGKEVEKRTFKAVNDKGQPIILTNDSATRKQYRALVQNILDNKGSLTETTGIDFKHTKGVGVTAVLVTTENNQEYDIDPNAVKEAFDSAIGQLYTAGERRTEVRHRAEDKAAASSEEEAPKAAKSKKKAKAEVSSEEEAPKAKSKKKKKEVVSSDSEDKKTKKKDKKKAEESPSSSEAEDVSESEEASESESSNAESSESSEKAKKKKKKTKKEEGFFSGWFGKSKKADKKKKSESSSSSEESEKVKKSKKKKKAEKSESSEEVKKTKKKKKADKSEKSKKSKKSEGSTKFKIGKKDLREATEAEFERPSSKAKPSRKARPAREESSGSEAAPAASSRRRPPASRSRPAPAASRTRDERHAAERFGSGFHRVADQLSGDESPEAEPAPRTWVPRRMRDEAKREATPAGSPAASGDESPVLENPGQE